MASFYGFGSLVDSQIGECGRCETCDLTVYSLDHENKSQKYRKMRGQTFINKIQNINHKIEGNVDLSENAF